VETTTGNTGQGAPAAVTSSTAANVPSAARAYALSELIDAFMAAYAGADRSIGGRLDFWRRSLGARPAAAISSDDVADALAALMQASGRTFLGRDESGAPRFKPRGPIAGTTANRHLPPRQTHRHLSMPKWDGTASRVLTMRPPSTL
jgi:hypothetical protein